MRNLAYRIPFLVTLALCLALGSGCQVINVMQSTPLPLVTNTAQLRLEQVPEMPTLLPMTATPTMSAEKRVNYQGEVNIFDTVSESLPVIPFRPVSVFGTMAEVDVVTKEKDDGEEEDPYLYMYYYNPLPVEESHTFTLTHSSGAEFTVECDDFCFVTDQRKMLIPRSELAGKTEVLVYGTAMQDLSLIRADVIVVRGRYNRVKPAEIADMSKLPQPFTYKEHELTDPPELNPLRITAAPTREPTPTGTPDPNDYSYYYNYTYNNESDKYWYDPYFGYYPKKTEDPSLTLNEKVENRLLHSLEERKDFSYGLYGEEYSAALKYVSDTNRNPEYPTRSNMSVMSNDYEFFDFWFPNVENPMITNYGMLAYNGDWYVPIRMSVDLNPDPQISDLLYCDRTMTNQSTLEKQNGYLRAFGFSILNRKLFYFYEKETGYGVSIDKTDYDLGFEDIPFGMLSPYNLINPFYSDDLVTFFGYRDGTWYYVEINAPQPDWW